jgi:hypothetical protein
MAFRFSLRRRPVEPKIPAEPPVAAKPSVLRHILGLFGALGRAIGAAFAGLDRALTLFAIPFGVRVRDPLPRYALLLGVYALIFIMGSLQIRTLPLLALVFGYTGVLAIGRAWVVNEKERALIVKKLKDEDPDQLPDLRWTALVSALQLFILFPLLYQQMQWHFQLFKVGESATFLDWLWFSLDKTYLKALPDWSILYGVHISSIDFDASWGRHLVLLSRLTFDYILLQGIYRLLAIRATINEAVAAVKADPGMAVRLGRRAIAPLLRKLHDPDKAVRGAAANALMQLGDSDAIRRISEVVPD